MVAFLGFYAAAELSHFVENCAESASASVGSKICPLVFRILYTVWSIRDNKTTTSTDRAHGHTLQGH